jgi:hypothetical protein
MQTYINISNEFVKCPQMFQILQIYPLKNLQPIPIIPSQIGHFFEFAHNIHDKIAPFSINYVL